MEPCKDPPIGKVNGQLLACVPAHRSVEAGSLLIRADFEERAELLAAAPDVYYVTDHYVDYSAVLVRLSRSIPEGNRITGDTGKSVEGREGAGGVCSSGEPG